MQPKTYLESRLKQLHLYMPSKRENRQSLRREVHCFGTNPERASPWFLPTWPLPAEAPRTGPLLRISVAKQGHAGGCGPSVTLVPTPNQCRVLRVITSALKRLHLKIFVGECISFPLELVND